MTREQLGEAIDRKHVLLDTCFIAKAHQYVDTQHFDGLFSLLQDFNCVPIINEFIKFEFLRGCQTKSQIETKTNFLDALSGFTMPIDSNILEGAIEISNIYSNKQLKQVSRVDCYISAYLKKYHGSLFMITLNNSDYPLLLHDRLYIHTIDTDKEILTIGFYTFNAEKFSNCLSDIR